MSVEVALDNDSITACILCVEHWKMLFNDSDTKCLHPGGSRLQTYLSSKGLNKLTVCSTTMNITRTASRVLYVNT